MVKGVTKRVVVVRCPDTKYFEQAIFMVRDDSLTAMGVSPEQALEEACRVADTYIRQNTEKKKGRIGLLVAGGAALLGTLVALVLWLL